VSFIDSAEPLARSCAIDAGVELRSNGMMAAALRALAIMPFEPLRFSE